MMFRSKLYIILLVSIIILTWNIDYSFAAMRPPQHKITLKTTDGESVSNAHVLLVADNNTFIEQWSGKDGNITAEYLTGKRYAIWVASPTTLAYYQDDIDVENDLEIILRESRTKGSVLIPKGAGIIPGLSGPLNPILDTSDRTYIYASNIAIDGGKTQPVTFSPGIPLRMEDNQGVLMNVAVIQIKGSSSLLEYEPLGITPKTAQRKITLNTTERDLVSNAHVLLVADNNTFIEQWSDTDGNITVEYLTGKRYAIWVASPTTLAYYKHDIDTERDLEIILIESTIKGSVLIPKGAGSIPGLSGSLNPILDTSDRTYIYASNIAIGGGKTQPVGFSPGIPMRTEDNQGVLMNVSVIRIKGSSSLLEYEPLEIVPKTTQHKITLKTTDGEPVSNAHVLLVADNNTFIEKWPGKDGNITVKYLTGKRYAIWVASPTTLAYYQDNIDVENDLEIILRESKTKGSVLIPKGAGGIPGLSGSLNPILDTSNRTYIYASNIAIDDGKMQPVTFSLSTPLRMEDNQGVAMNIAVIQIRGSSSLLEYEIINNESAPLFFRDNIYYINNDFTLGNGVIEGSLFIGPDSTVTVLGQVVIKGDVYVFGSLLNLGEVKIEGTLFVDPDVFAIPLILDNNKKGYFEAKDDIIMIKGSTIPFVDMFIDDNKIDLGDDGSFCLSLNVKDRNEVLFKIEDRQGNTAVRMFGIYTPIAGVELNTRELDMRVQETALLTLSIFPENATNKTMKWSTSDSIVAEVNKDGKVTAVSKGTAIITVTTEDGNHTESCKVTVEKDAQWQTWEPKYNIEPDSAWMIEFNKILDAGTIKEKNIYVTDGKKQIIPMFYYQKQQDINKYIYIVPVKDYQSGQTYTLWIKDLKAEDGSVLSKNIKMEFRIRGSIAPSP